MSHPGIFRNESAPRSAKAVWLICVSLLFLGASLTFWGISLSRDYNKEMARIRFEAQADKMVSSLNRRMSRPVYGLKGAAGLYAASKSVERLEFRAYVDSRNFDQEFPGVLGFGFIQKVRQKDLPSFILMEKADHAPDFDVFPKSNADELYIAKFLDPLEVNRKAWGYDIGSDPLRKRAIDRAVRTGLPALTERVTLFQAKKEEVGFLWLLPVYQNGTRPATAEERQASLYGLVFAPVVLDKVFHNVMEEYDGMLDVEIFEGEELSSSHLLVDADKVPVSATDAPVKQAFDGRLFHFSRKIEIGGQIWTCVITSTKKYEKGVETALPMAVAVGGLLLTGTLVLLFLSLGNSRARAVVLAEKMTESLRLSEMEARRLAMVASRTDNAVVITDVEGRIEWVNKGFTNVTGYDLEEVKGRRPGSFLQGPGTDAEIVALMRKGMSEGRGFNVEVQNYRKSGKPYWVAIEAQPLYDEAGNRTGFMAVERDITERRQAEQELWEAKHSAEAANRAKSEFLAMMSHEIRTPMNGVIGMTSLLLDTPLNNQQREYTEIIRTSGETLLSLINDILDFSKIESGRFELESAVFNIRDCVEGTLDLLAMSAAHKNLDLLYEITDGVPVEVKGDVTRVRQILVNLIGNALKFTKEGEVEVTVRSEARVGGKIELLFTVRDTGIGIPQDALDRLFRPFTQVDASTTRKYGGTGLGLAISRKLAELMGGRMWVKSEAGRGSTFFFKVQVDSVASGAKPFVSSTHHRLKGRRVLLVDDNATNLRILSSYADTWGLEAVQVESGVAALKLFEEGPRPDFVILDMQMPGMDGVMLAREIQRRYGSSAPPLLLLSSLGLSERSHEEGLFAASLTKPAKPAQIFNALISMAATEKSAVRETVEKGPVVASPAFDHVKILLAEDNHVNQKVARALLANLGYKTDVAANGLEVLEALKRQSYDIIFMDMQMPEMDGVEATRRIRACGRPGEKGPWIIALTANAMTEDRDLCLSAGMDDYLSKPIKKEALATSLGRALDRGAE